MADRSGGSGVDQVNVGVAPGSIRGGKEDEMQVLACFA